MTKNIKYIFFDLDDTLFPTTQFAELARKNAVRAMVQHGLKTDYSSCYLELLRIIKDKGSNFDKHFNTLCEKFNGRIEPRIVAAGVMAYHNSKNTILPFPNTYQTLLKLREQDYRLFIATNGNPVKQWEKVIRLNIDFYFEDIFISEEMGMLKSKKFFEKVMKQLKIKPEQCLMVGNSIDIDIYPALRAGMRAVLVDHYSFFSELKKKCRKHGSKYSCRLNRNDICAFGVCSSENPNEQKDFLIIDDIDKVFDILKH